jgi:DNA (cytosine-5)-methyltransferase 1
MVIPFVKAKRAQSSEDDETWEADRPAPTLSVFDSGDTRATVAIVTPAPEPIAFDRAEAVQVQWASGGGKLENATAQALRANAEHSYQFLRSGYAVRRLTPRECERLQGFPDDWTAIPYRGKPAADGPRYKATGNSMAVPVMGWIGKRIKAWEDGSL